MIQRKPLSEMLAALRAPVPRELISQKDTGGRGFQADYVNVTDRKDLLDERLGAGNWSALVDRTDCTPDLYIIIVRMTIFGSDYSIAQDGTGTETLEGRHYGDIASNAYAQAFARACESFGFARELWRGEDNHSSGNQDNYQLAQGQQQQSQPRSTPTNPIAKTLNELVTPKQLGMIRAICRDLSIDPETELEEAMKVKCQLPEISRKAASSFIDHLKALEQSGNPVSQNNLPGSQGQLLAEVKTGIAELNLNVGQLKEFTMRVLGLRAAPELDTLDVKSLQVVADAIKAELMPHF